MQSTFPRYATPLILLFLLPAACKPHITSTWTSSSDSTVNGYTKSKRTKDGITRRLETGATVEIDNGIVTKFPTGTIIKLEETGGSEARLAELREDGNRLELWIKEKDGFRRATPEEEAWLSRFLSDFTTK